MKHLGNLIPRWRSLAAAAILLALPFSAGTRAEPGTDGPPRSQIKPNGPSATVLSEEAGGVLLRFEAPTIQWSERAGRVYPTARGFGLLDESGRPALPVRIERVAIPAGAQPRLRILDAQSVEGLPGLVGPVQRWIPVSLGSDESVPVDTEDPAVYGVALLCPDAEPVRLGQIGALREQPFVELIFTPVLHDPASRSTVVYRSVTVHVDFGVTPERTPPVVDPDFEDVYEAGSSTPAKRAGFAEPAPRPPPAPTRRRASLPRRPSCPAPCTS